MTAEADPLLPPPPPRRRLRLPLPTGGVGKGAVRETGSSSRGATQKQGWHVQDAVKNKCNIGVELKATADPKTQECTKQLI